MKLSNSFNDLTNLRKRINAKELNDSFDSALPSIDKINLQLESDGLEVKREDIYTHGKFITYKGDILAILYIYDYRASRNDLLSELVTKKAPKFHFTWCHTLVEMDSKGKFARYILTKNKKNKFKVQATERDPISISIYGEHHELKDITLYPCRYCLTETMYKNYRHTLPRNTKDRLVKAFSIKDYIEENQATFDMSKFYLKASNAKYNDATVQPMVYTDDFPEISRMLRESNAWKCSKCKVDMSKKRAGLHTHHINGVKNDNSSSNLQVLCALCHKNIDQFHKNMYVSREIEQYIIRQRT